MAAASETIVAPQPVEFVALDNVLAGAMQSWIDDLRDESLIREPGPATAERLANLLLLQTLLSQPIMERVPA